MTSSLKMLRSDRHFDVGLVAGFEFGISAPACGQDFLSPRFGRATNLTPITTGEYLQEIRLVDVEQIPDALVVCSEPKGILPLDEVIFEKQASDPAVTQFGHGVPSWLPPILAGQPIPSKEVLQ